MTKVCTKCKEEKDLENYNKDKSTKDGYKSNCKGCVKQYNKQYRQNNKEKIKQKSKQYYEENKEQIAEYQKQYRQDNKGQIVERKKQYRQDNKERLAEQKKQYYQDNKEQLAEQKKQYYQDNREQFLEKSKQYQQDNKEQIAEYHKQYEKRRLETDEHFCIKKLLRNRLRSAFRSYSTTGKLCSADEYGINYQAIIEHLGPCPGERDKYHIDHIIPLASYDFDDEDQIREAFNPENHQWLLAEENLKKRSENFR